MNSIFDTKTQFIITHRVSAEDVYDSQFVCTIKNSLTYNVQVCKCFLPLQHWNTESYYFLIFKRFAISPNLQFRAKTAVMKETRHILMQLIDNRIQTWTWSETSSFRIGHVLTDSRSDVNHLKKGRALSATKSKITTNLSTFRTKILR